jgi:hypothetical protein
MVSERSLHIGELLLAVALLAPPFALSQQPTDPGSTQDPGSANPPTQTQTSGTDAGTPQSEPNPAATTQGLFARALNSASPLAGYNGPLQWGWVSVRSVSYLQYFTSETLDNTGMAPVSQDSNAGELSTTIVLNHAFGASRTTQLTVQYAPSVFISEGHVYTNAMNQSAGLDTTFQFGPRWSLQLSDRFSYFANQQYFSGLSLGVDYTQGTVAQNNFLNGPGRVIYESAGATITYLWSPNTKVSVTPTFGYQNSTGAVTTGAANNQQNLSSFSGGAQVNISHAVSATATVGLSYSGQYATYANTSTTAGPQSNNYLQDLLINYGKQIGASWHLNLGLGLTSATNGGNQIGLAASAGITKSFQKMDFAVNYYRGHQFNGYITSASTDRIDLVNTIRWNRRFSSSTSVAYFRTASTSTPGPSGTYASEQLSFKLTRALSLTGGVGYSKQTGDGVYVQDGHTQLATVGVTWSPAATQ